MERTFLYDRLVIETGDLTDQDTDAIVNAANWTLLGGGGVDGAIHRHGGPQILEECKRIRETEYPKGLPTGQAVITTGGDLKAKHVIHTVGPIYGQNEGRDAELLADSYRNSLELAVANSLRSVAFPSISTGAFGYPKHEAAPIAAQTVGSFFENDEFLKEVRLVFFSDSDAEMFLKHAQFKT